MPARSRKARGNGLSTSAPTRSPRLSEAEREAVVASIQEFQLGESSEGRHLHRLAAEYARQTGDEDYPRAVEYFIREEQRHASYLRDFLALEGFGTVKRRWADTVFRRLRNLAGLEVSIGVLLTAEIIAKVYYAGLKGATSSPALRRICERVLRDEEAHVRFQSERLAMLRHDRPQLGRKLTGLLHRTLFFGACLVVWRNHGKVVRRTGLPGLLAPMLGGVRSRRRDDGPGELRALGARPGELIPTKGAGRRSGEPEVHHRDLPPRYRGGAPSSTTSSRWRSPVSRPPAGAGRRSGSVTRPAPAASGPPSSRPGRTPRPGPRATSPRGPRRRCLCP